MKVYVAFDKVTGTVVHGQRGQTVFGDKGNLKRSMVHVFEYLSLIHGKKAKEFYYIKEFEINESEGEVVE